MVHDDRPVGLDGLRVCFDDERVEAAEAAGVDVVLVGDSGAMTVLGYPSTVPVSSLASAAQPGSREQGGRERRRHQSSAEVIHE